MIVLAISLLLAAGTFALVLFLFNWVAAVFPAIVVFGVAYFVLARRISKKFEQAMYKLQGDLQRGQIDRAVQILEDLKKRFGNWQFFTKSTIDGQIGSIYFMRQEFDRARPYLERAFVRHWVAKGMLGVLQFRKKDYAAMDKTFEHALRYSGKQGLLWSIWAYCHWKAGHFDRSREILLQGQKKLGDADQRLAANLNNLQNEKKMKMHGYGEQWYQFQLEMPRVVRQMRSRQVRYR